MRMTSETRRECDSWVRYAIRRAVRAYVASDDYAEIRVYVTGSGAVRIDEGDADYWRRRDCYQHPDYWWDPDHREPDPGCVYSFSTVEVAVIEENVASMMLGGEITETMLESAAWDQWSEDRPDVMREISAAVA
jgi:hypothetical protein